MATTVKDLIKSAFRKAGIVATGETPSASEIADGLETFNDLVVEWTSETLASFSPVQSTFSLTSGTSSVTVGPSGDIDIQRPEQIISAYITNSSGYDEDQLNSMGRLDYDEIADKTASGTPNSYFFDASVSTAKVYLYPVTAQTVTLNITTISAVDESTLSTDLEAIFPRNMIVAFKHGLTVELAGEYGAPISPSMLSKAAKTKGDIETINFVRSIQPVNVNRILGRSQTGGNFYNC